MKTTLIKLSIFCFILLMTPFYLKAQDIAGAKDHPIISRYPDSEISYYYERKFDKLQMALGHKAGKPNQWKEIKGKHTSIIYNCPKGRTPLEVMENYRQAIKNGDFEILYSCSGKYAPNGCDDYKQTYGLNFFPNVYSTRTSKNDHYTGINNGSDDQEYLVAKSTEGNKEIYIEIGIRSGWSEGALVCLEIVEVEAMQTGLIKVDANTIKKKLDKDGKIALYGIYFDSGKSSIKSGSEEELTAVYEFLKQNPTINLYVVGHTDDRGNFDANLRLSEARAAAVVNYLKNKGIATSRLKAYGDGPTAPLASNQTEAGRQKNRRVELVRRLN